MVNQALRSQTIEDLAAAAFRRGAAAEAGEPRDRRGGASHRAPRGRGGADGAAGAADPPPSAGGGRPGAALRRGRDAAPSGPGADGEGGRQDRPRGARRHERGVRRDAGRSRGQDLRARRATSSTSAHRASSRPILFDELELPSTKRTRTSRSTDASVLEELRDKHEVIGLILEHRQVSKLKSTYVDALPTLVDDQDRLHTTYQQAVAATGRLSSTDPNLQNIPIRTALGRRIRRAFVAPPGKLLLGADYSQQELRILAHVSQDPGPEGRLRRPRRHPPRRRGARPWSGTRPGRAEGAQRGEDDQLRDRLRAVRLRAGPAAEHPARGGARLHRGLLRRLPGDPALHDRDEDPGARPGVRHHPPRPAAIPAGACGPQPVASLGGGANGHQHADPGHGGRRHEDRHGAAGCRDARARPALRDAAPGPRRAHLRDR